MVQMIADRLGIVLDEIRESFERSYADASFDTPMMQVPKGTCDAVRFQLEGMANGRPVVVTEHVNRMREAAGPEWPRPPEGRAGVHRCIVTGNPSVQLECFLRGEDGDHNTGGVQATALRVINAIPALCAHAPGMISTLDLPWTPTANVVGG
jgi:4-hydroxy-tetrahydrodipicolinate reductase